MNIGAKLIAGFVAISGLALLFVFIGRPGIGQGGSHIETFKQYGATLQAVDLARRAQVNFRLQMQDWNDLLLRGHEPASHDRYLAGFEQQEGLTQKELSGLKVLLARLGLPTAKVALALQAHLELGKTYRAALASFIITDQPSSAVVDKLVMGTDRPFTGEMDNLVADLNEFAETAAAAATAQASAQNRTIRIASGFAVIAGIFAAVMLGAFLSLAVTWPSRRMAGSLSDAIRQSAAAVRIAPPPGFMTETGVPWQETGTRLEVAGSRATRSAGQGQVIGTPAHARNAANPGVGSKPMDKTFPAQAPGWAGWAAGFSLAERPVKN